MSAGGGKVKPESELVQDVFGEAVGPTDLDGLFEFARFREVHLEQLAAHALDGGEIGGGFSKVFQS